MPISVGHYHLLHNLLNVFVGRFDCVIHFRSIRRRIVMFDLKLSAKFGNQSTVEVSPIIGNDPFGDTIAADEVMLDESGYNVLCD